MSKGTWKITLAGIAVGLACFATADWQAAYQTALDAAREGRWAEARDAFQLAAAHRPADSDRPTTLPGPVTEPRRWRGGAPYSPNFGAAYAAYRIALATQDPNEKNRLLALAADELNNLIGQNQISPEALAILRKIFNATGDTEGKASLDPLKPNWTVDNEFLAPEDRPQGTTRPAPSRDNNRRQPGDAPVANIIDTGQGTLIRVEAGNETDIEALLGTDPVPIVESKFAIVIGNSESNIPDADLPFAVSDAQAVAQALTQFAGYSPANITTLTNASASDILAAANALAERLPSESTVLIYFTGVGVNLGDRDYFVGVDAEFATDTTKMVEKTLVLRPFVERGANIFIFHQANRPIVDGRFFGAERIRAGRVSEVQATKPGSVVSSVIESGQARGLYTQAFIRTLSRFRTNQVPIMDFAWNVFYALRRGREQVGGGGSLQTPTLPVLNNLSDRSRF